MTFLNEKLRDHDALLVRVFSASGQKVQAELIRSYSSNFAVPGGYPSGRIVFIGGPSHWGNAALLAGEEAVVFVRYLGEGRGLYQDPWHGHLSIAEVSGNRCAIAHWNLLSNGRWDPPDLYAACFHPSPNNPVGPPYPFMCWSRTLRQWPIKHRVARPNNSSKPTPLRSAA